MRIGFSSQAAPMWDLPTLITNAASHGYDGIELRGLAGQLDLPMLPQLSAHPEQVKALCTEHKVELVCLSSSVALDSTDRKTLARQIGELTDYVELADALGCPFVKIFAGEVQERDNLRAAQARIAQALIEVAPIASRRGVTILVENGNDLADSAAMWFLVDAAESPAIQVCWNQCHALTVGERPTTSIPRLGTKIGMVHVCDADFDDCGLLIGYKALGEGNAEVARQVELLKGLAYRGYLMFDWPRLWDASLPHPDAVLPEAARFLREQIDTKQNILSAYKGDKRPTKFCRSVAAGE
ncbi:MAG: sugar phosphate isomerase/epimerase family protein [Phycisphaerae bacterium]